MSLCRRMTRQLTDINIIKWYEKFQKDNKKEEYTKE